MSCVPSSVVDGSLLQPEVGVKKRSNSLPVELATTRYARKHSILTPDSISLLEQQQVYHAQVLLEHQNELLQKGVKKKNSKVDPNEEPDEISDKEKVEEVKKLWKSYLTLFQHYYPEGGWGWVIVTCAVLVQVTNHGL